MNTVLWNTIQLLFPKEVESRKAAAGALNSREEVKHQSPKSGSRSSSRRTRGSIRPPMVSARDAALALRLQREDLSRLVGNTDTTTTSTRRRRGGTPGQDEDAALALRLQREEFMESFGGTHHQQTRTNTTSLSLARANLRAMASRAINVRARGRPV